MAYCTLQDLLEYVDENVVVRLTQDDPEETSVNEDVVTRAIADAAALVDGYVSTRYQVPLTPVPPLIRRVSVHLTRYTLFSRRGLDEDSADKTVVREYHEAVKLLTAISRGEVQLGTPVAAATPGPGARLQSAPRRMSRESLEGF